MGEGGAELERIKAEQRERWSAVAAGWEKWFDLFERGAGKLSDRLLDLGGIGPGKKVLDVASGLGEPALAAARRVGGQGHVVATDLVAELLARAETRAAELGLRNLSFHEMDAEAPDLAEESFDAIVCRLGLMFLPELGTALAALRKLLVPDGRLAAAVWAPPDEVPSISLSGRVVRRELGLLPPAEGALTPFALSDEGAFRAAFESAGFAEVRCERLTVTFEFPSCEAYTRFRRDVTTLDAEIAEEPRERREAAWQAVTEAVRHYAEADGRVVMRNQAICVVARR